MNVVNTSIPLYQTILLHMKAMNSYCVSCKKKKKKNSANKNSSVRTSEQNRLMLYYND